MIDMRSKLSASAMLLALGTVAPAANAAGVVSWSFDNNNTIGGSGTAQQFGDHGSAGADDFAGVVSVDWWGNSWNGVDAQVTNGTNLADDDGNATTIDMSTNTGNNFNAGAYGVDTDGLWNRTMLSAYVNNNDTASDVQFTISDITTSFAVYDVYVYFMSDEDSRVGDITVDGMTRYFGANPTSVNSNDPALFNQATATTTAGYDVDANYAVFSGLTADSITMTAKFWTDNTASEGSFGGISGFQIVEVPEPSVALLGGLGLLGLLRRRR